VRRRALVLLILLGPVLVLVFGVLYERWH